MRARIEEAVRELERACREECRGKIPMYELWKDIHIPSHPLTLKGESVKVSPRLWGDVK